MTTSADAFINARQPSEGPATILAIATANPQHYVLADTFPDQYFRDTNSEHMVELKEKFKRMCEKTTIRKRHSYVNEEILKKHPELISPSSSSFNTRQDIVVEEVPKLGHVAAQKAIQEWGRPKSDITHLVFYTTTGFEMPGADLELANLLGLGSSVKRHMLYQLGCYAGGTLLRLAKDLAENNKGARVLVVCAEILLVSYFAPSESNMMTLISQAAGGDGAAALIIGSDPDVKLERPIFRILSANQTFIPGTKDSIRVRAREIGQTLEIARGVPEHISRNVGCCLEDAFKPLGISDWNSIFWVAHPGGVAYLDRIEEALGLRSDKLSACREILREYGNMASATVFFILDLMRKKSTQGGLKTTGEGLEWGVLFGFGSGITIETVVLQSISI
ncbi:uncharacterized protein [Phyllobates terribilis]|uniref:uncharacterized protein n=1 Tax=Phyllobates terribilis TaxID=111132 RepID=UPI003CCB3080